MTTGERWLVTGAGGFVGRRLVAALTAAGGSVVGWRRTDADLTDPDAVARAMARVAPTHIVHLAAGPPAPHAADWHHIAAEVAMIGNLAVLMPDRCRLIHTGSMAEFGRAGRFDETAQCRPSSAYGLAKAAAGDRALALRQLAGCDIVVARLFGVYGPGRRLVGCCPMSRPRWPGRRVALSAGDQVRDFVHVDDVCTVLIALARAPGPPALVNVGTGIGLSVRQVCEAIADVLGAPRDLLGFGDLPYRAVDEAELVADTTLLSRHVAVPPQRWLDPAGLKKRHPYRREDYAVKIVMLCEFYNEELDYQEVMLAKYYCALGHDVVVIAGATISVYDYMAGKDAAADHTVEEGRHARIYRMPVRTTLLRKIVVYRSIRAIVEEERPDLLYFHDIIPNMLETLPYLRQHAEVCAIMDYHADFSNSGATRLSRLLLHRLSRRLILARIRARLSAILPIVPGSQRFLADLYGIPAEETELFPLGVDTREAAAAQTSGAREEIRHALGIPDDALVVFTGGKLTRLKRTEEVLRAVVALGDPRSHVIVVGTVTGDDEYDALLRDVAGPTAHFVGWQDRVGVYRHQAAADLAVFPASQSVLWQQSIGMGLPLVVSEGGETGRAQQDVGYMNWSNIHVLHSARDLASQITAFLAAARDDRDILDRMRVAARAVTDDLLGYDRLARRTLEIANAHRMSVGAAPLLSDPRRGS